MIFIAIKNRTVLKIKIESIYKVNHLLLLSIFAVVMAIAFVACSGSGTDNNNATPESMVELSEQQESQIHEIFDLFDTDGGPWWWLRVY